MDNSISFHIIRRMDERDIGPVSVNEGLHFDVSGTIEEARMELSLRFGEIFSGGVSVMAHGPDADDDRHSLISKTILPSDRDFFPTVIDMIDSSEYRVVFPETEERKQILESIVTLLSTATLEEGYKRMVMEKLLRLLDWQLKDILKTLTEERDVLKYGNKNTKK